MSLSRLHLVLTAASLMSAYVYAQPNDRSLKDTSFQVALKFYHQSLGDQSSIYNGSLYLRPSITPGNNHVYFRTDALSRGDVVYDGVPYSSIPLLYDQQKDALVTTDITGLNLVSLVKEKVASFTIDSATFENIPHKTGSGFYRVVRNGDLKILHRETKFIRQKIVREKEMNSYIQTNSSYWILTATNLYEIRNEKDLLNVFSSSKKAVQSHLRSTRLKFRRNPERTLMAAVTFYEKMQHP